MNKKSKCWCPRCGREMHIGDKAYDTAKFSRHEWVCELCIDIVTQDFIDSIEESRLTEGDMEE